MGVSVRERSGEFRRRARLPFEESRPARGVQGDLPHLGQGMTASRQLDPEHLGDHLDRLYRAARGLCGSREDAEDLVQETYAQILRKPRFLQSDDDIRYLLRALRNTFVGTHRLASRRPQTLPLPDELEILADVNAPAPEAQAEMTDVYEAIAALPPAFRDAIVAVDLVGLSYREAAVTLRVREATITTRLHRARQQVARTVTG